MSDEEQRDVPFTLALIAGGCAGTTVDVALYPLDTLRTRLQSPDGFWKAGGFSRIYSGVLATALGAAPGAAFFFSAYEGMKPVLKRMNGGQEHPIQHSCAASCGEVAACLVRVPTAVVTQRMQMGQYASFNEAVVKIAAENGVMTFYTGYWTTVAREIPFSFIQFPIYEALKRAWERAPEPCVFEVDSLLVAEQLNGNYACRSTDLQGTYSKCVEILKGLTARGQPWEIRHIYREYNATADALAGQGASFSGRRQSGAW